jgi:hypothetical protein
VRGPTAKEIRLATKDVEERKPLKLHPQEFTSDVSGTVDESHSVRRWADRQVIAVPWILLDKTVKQTQ